MLLGNAHVEIALGEAALEFDHARAFTHGGRDAHQAFVGRRHVAQPLAKHLGEGGLGDSGGLHDAHRRIEGARAVVRNRIVLGQLVALAFFGHHVQELRPTVGLQQVADVLQRGDQRVQVVTVDGADVVEAELLEQRGGHHHALGLLFEPLGQFEQGRRALEHRLAHIFRRGVELPAHELGKVAVERAHRRRDRHVVVVEHHQQAALGHASVVERFKGHAGGHGTVTDDGHGIAVLAFDAGAHGHAERRRDAGGRMGRSESVELALRAARETTDATELAQRVHAVAPAGQDLVRVGLVAHVPHEAVFGGVEHVVQRQGELDGAEVGAEVATGARHALQQVGAQFVCQRQQLRAAQAAHIGR